MAISITSGKQIVSQGTAQSVQNIVASTATAFATANSQVSTLSLDGGTATGIISLALTTVATSGHSEGDELTVVMTATGEQKVHFGGGTATGLWVFQSANDLVLGKYVNGIWRVLFSDGATLSTGT